MEARRAEPTRILAKGGTSWSEVITFLMLEVKAEDNDQSKGPCVEAEKFLRVSCHRSEQKD